MLEQYKNVFVFLQKDYDLASNVFLSSLIYIHISADRRMSSYRCPDTQQDPVFTSRDFPEVHRPQGLRMTMKAGKYDNVTSPTLSENKPAQHLDSFDKLLEFRHFITVVHMKY